MDLIRPHVTVEELIKGEVPSLNLGKHLTEAVSEGLQVLTQEELLHKLYRPTLTRFYLRTPPWLWGVEPQK